MKGLCTVTVTTTGAGSEQIGSNTYDIYTYSGTIGTWMVQNSKEGTASYTNGNNKYYSWSQRNNACPFSWSVPNQTQWEALQTYINNTATSTEKAMWNSGSALAGGYSVGTLVGSGSYSHWWSSSVSYQYFYVFSGNNLSGPATSDTSPYFTVRCIKSN
ncbi:hypothetical protein FACS189413_01370 [Bacteroidia bacterium]|nr:hypothetical protein FACS189413_01370 [Bacteroidia bacterium]